ncbi:MAG: hypothetical protein K6G91_01825 [Kiritimatiellae bacterium]|nr:hypothetical protein [Kiritimatiellia bacterium]
MKSLIVVAAICAAFCAGALPTRDALEAARPRVEKLSMGIVDKLRSGGLKPGEGADALVALADAEAGEAEKLLLLNAALRLHMRGGDIAGAKVVADKLKSDVKGLTVAQLNDMMLEESGNFCAALLGEDEDAAPAVNGKEWHVDKSRLEKDGLTVTSLDELRRCDRSKVVRLYLRGAKGVTAKDLKGLTGIRALDLSETGIDAIPPSVFSLKTLRWLWLARNPIKEVPLEIRNLASLTYLNLDGTQVDRIPDGLIGLGSFRYLRMNDTPLDDGVFTDAAGETRSRFVETLSQLKLRRLYARSTKITRMPSSGSFGELTDLDVGRTKLAEISPDWKWLGGLRTVSFAGCPKLVRFPEGLGGLSNVQVVDISGTPMAKDKDEIARVRRAFGEKTTVIY